MRCRYYKITGLDEGVPIEPFAVTSEDLDRVLEVHGDMCRYYEPITKSEYEKMNAIKREVSQLVKDIAKAIGNHDIVVFREWDDGAYEVYLMSNKDGVIDVTLWVKNGGDEVLILGYTPYSLNLIKRSEAFKVTENETWDGMDIFVRYAKEEK